MTTTVIVQAHVSEEKEVSVIIIENGKAVDEAVLQDGETTEKYIYDDREILIQEVMKAG